jgi:expansin (peptidoglycan-binding protein)
MTPREQPWIPLVALMALMFVQPACVLPPDASSEAGPDSGKTENEGPDDARVAIEARTVVSQDEANEVDEDGRPEMAESAPSSAPDGSARAMAADSAAIAFIDAANDVTPTTVADTSARLDSEANDASETTSGPLCTYGSPTSGSGSFTWYYFGQGTAQQDGAYLTACGYQGRETGMIDTVQNIASASPASSSYFAAIPGSSGFNTVDDCGACVEIVNGGTSIVATIIDECPTDNGQNPLCSKAGHLDLSYAAWKALGYSSGDPSGTTWRFVACPVSGFIVARLKSGNADQLYLENTPFPIVSVTVGGQQAHHLSYGAWQLPNGMSAAGATLTLQDVEGHSTTIEVGAGGDTGKQFSSACQGQ